MFNELKYICLTCIFITQKCKSKSYNFVTYVYLIVNYVYISKLEIKSSSNDNLKSTQITFHFILGLRTIIVLIYDLIFLSY